MTVKKIVNLTPHDLTLRGPMGDSTIPPSGTVARIATTENPTGEFVHDLPIVEIEHGQVSNLPEPEEGTLYVVSSMVAMAVRRPDVIAPDTGRGAVRDGKGRIIAVTRFVRPAISAE